MILKVRLLLHLCTSGVQSFPCLNPRLLHHRMGLRLQVHIYLPVSLVLRPSTPNAVEGLVKLIRRMTSGGRLEAWLIAPCMHNTAVHRKCHTSKRPPDVILRRSFTRPSTALGVEGLGTRLSPHLASFSGSPTTTAMFAFQNRGGWE